MKKKVFIGLGIVAFIGLASFIGWQALSGQEKQAVSQAEPPDYGIEYFEVPEMPQVFINGVVQPEQAESFTATEEVGTTTPQLKVKNGEIVEKGQVLYTLEDANVTKELEGQNNTWNRLGTRRANIEAKWNRAITKLNATKKEERTTTADEINEQYQGEIESVDEEIQYTNETIADLKEKQAHVVEAKFKGRVTIPEVKEANSPILRLVSDKLYMSGKVSEKDLHQIKVDQKAVLTVVSNGETVDGHITYIDDNPPETTGDGDMGMSEGGNSALSTYLVKIAIDDPSVVKNGYHLQATVNVGEEAPVEIPKSAIKEEKAIKYVLVDDFGTVIRREIQTGKENGDNITITGGLESADRIILSSKKAVKEGDVISVQAE